MRWWVALLGLAASAAYAEPQADASAWLQKIAAAARQLNYTGTFVYQHGSQVETSSIVHMVDHAGEHEKLEALDGPPREVIRDNNEVQCFVPGGKTVKIERHKPHLAFPDLLPEQMDGIAESYTVKLNGQQRVAGFECQVIALEPKDSLRYGHQLCADAHSGLLLSTRMLNEKNEVVEQIAFTQAAIGWPIAKQMLKPHLFHKGGWKHELPASEAQPVESGWSVQNFPAGFKKIMEMKRSIHGKPVPVTHLVFSDGLAAVSVFIEPLPQQAKVGENLSQQGAINIYVRPYFKHLVTVVGEVPAATVTQIGNSVNYKDKP